MFNDSNPVRDSVTAVVFPEWIIYKCCLIFIKQYAAFRAKGRIVAVNSYVCKSGTIIKNINSNGSNAARDSYACKIGTFIKSLRSNGSNSSDKAEVLDFLKASLRDNDAVLYKASRSMRMEDIIRDYYVE